MARRHRFQPRTSPLSGKRERELIAATDAGDVAASEELVDAFMPAIDSVARHYGRFACLEPAEFRQEGVVGLLKAAKRYDASLGTPFWAYASWWVRQAMQQLVAELSGPVVLSDRATRHLVHITRARGEYEQAHGEEPSVGELAVATDLPRDQVEDLMAIERPARGLDARAPGQAEEQTVSERLVDPGAEDGYEEVGELAEAEQMQELACSLDRRERDIVLAHYGIGSRARTLREIAAGLHLSVERVRQLEERALGKLRSAALAQGAEGHGRAVMAKRPSTSNGNGLRTGSKHRQTALST